MALWVAGGAASAQETGADAPLYAWLQHGAGGLEARAIVAEGSDCPVLTVDGRSIPMTERAAAGPDFPVVSCAVPVSTPAASIAMGGTALPPPTATPSRILVLGDTGCRIKGQWQENCDGEGTGVPWSFPAAAQAAAAEAPDLIVHVGDYVYRESPCDVAQQPGCKGSPWGDDWATWETDFFAPAAPLLDVAPWILTRGNHEDCRRSYRGWLRFLDGRMLAPTELTDDGCPLFSAPYKVDFESVDFLVLNTATTPESGGPGTSAATRYAEDFAVAAALVSPGQTTWTVTHRPFWAITPPREGTTLSVTDTTLQNAIAGMPGGGWPAEVDLALAGHVHLLETLSFPDGRPHQVVSGDAGTAQDPPITEAMIEGSPEVFRQLGISREDFNSYHDFGYVLLEPGEVGGWDVTVKSVAGEVLQRFHLE